MTASAAALPMLLQLLGAPRLLRDGQVLRVGSRKALALLAVTALDEGATRERLAGLLWPDVEPASARRNLRRELFRLRELGVPLVEAADGALGLDAGLAVDALRLLHEQALPSAGLPAFEGLDGIGSPELDIWLQRWRQQLGQRRLNLLTSEARASEQRGDLAAALSLHAERWAADLCDESAASQVIRLRAALGDPVGALHDCQRYADALRDELDVAPSEPARLLALDLRRRLGPAPVAATAIASAVKSVPTAIPRVAPFVRRGAVQQEVEAAWCRGQRVYLHGPAGIGKTRLACELASARGPWLRVACEPQDAELPYASVVRLLRALRDSAPDVVLPDWVRRELSQLMPELGEPQQTLATDEAQQRMLAAVAEAWRLLMHENFSALVLDDWQWGDSASVELWSRLDDPAAAAVAVAWIVSYRSAQLPVAALERQRADIDSGRGVAVALEGLGSAEVLALTQALSGSPGGALFSQRLHDATEGNPFFLLETLRHLFEQGLLVAGEGGWSTPFDEHTEDYAELPVPPSVRAAVLARVRALGVPMQRLLEIASLCSGGIDSRVLAGASGADEEAVVAALEHAQAAQLVGEGQRRWRFAHDLVRQSLAQGLSTARRRLLHERLAAQFERMVAAPALIAAHWESAERSLDAVPWRIAAAESAVRLHALADALAHYGQALADGAAGAVASRIHRAIAHIHVRRTHRAAAEAAFAASIESARGDPVEAAAEVLQGQLARADHLCVTDRVDESLALLDSLQADLADAAPAQRAHALAARGSALLIQGLHNDGRRLLGEAAELLEGQPESRGQLGGLLLELTRSALRRGDMEGARPIAHRAVAVHESIDAPSGLALALTLLGVVHTHTGERAQAITVIERARVIAARCGDVPAHRGAILNLVKLLADTGDTTAAIALLDEGEALAPSFEHRRAERAFCDARYCLHYLRGEVSEARAAAERLLTIDVGSMGPIDRIGTLAQVIDVFILAGDLDRAHALLAEAQILCDALKARGEGNIYGARHALKGCWLALLAGDAAKVLAGLPGAADLHSIEDHFGCAWIGSAAERQFGDMAAASRRLRAVDMNADVAVDTLVMWLVERLTLSAVEGAPSIAAEAHARRLLEAGRVPPLFVPRLERALAGIARSG